ncbi:MAG TPA: MBL fold metallo-hydrolase [Actinomycetes bacterium]|nr:MBL fold metallo-hydrolase [Actinomycetes bacterium]
MNALVDVLVEGYADERVAGTVTLIRDGDAVIVVDPGMVADRQLILDPLATLGVLPEAVTDVVFSHHHLDHTLHAALFPNARFHDFQAIYQGDVWEDRAAEGFAVGPHTRLLETRGHTNEDISTVVETEGGVVVLTHLWWMADGPLEDPFAPDAGVLRASRQRILALQPVQIIPGHGPAFVPDDATPV